MMPFVEFPADVCARIRFVLTDVDDTLTCNGRLPADTYAALERLSRAGIVVVPITAAPAGWCDLIARQWPVHAVIGENGGFYFAASEDRNEIRREFWLARDERMRAMARLETIAERIVDASSGLRIATDQRFRQTTWAIEPFGPDRAKTAEAATTAWRAAGAHCTINSLWVLAWLGAFDKLSMALRLGRELLAVDFSSERDKVVYIGDSLNDEAMFGFFPNAVGVSTVADYLDRMAAPPRWVTSGPGGAGFVEVADAILDRQ